MAPYDDTTPETRFDSFHVHRTPYKEINGQGIEAGILIPKDLKPGKHPILVRFHGGALITGDCFFADWFPSFLIPLIHRTNAIVVSPNYRLIPEHKGADVLEDLADFWKWLHTGGFTSYLASQNVDVELDFGRILATGDSAGGYMSLMSGMLQPKGSIKAIFVEYPMTYHLEITSSRMFPHLEGSPESFVDEHLKNIKPGVVVSSAVPPERMELAYGISVHGKYPECHGGDKLMWPLYLIEKQSWLPPTWIEHGEIDSLVSIEDSKAFVAKCKAIDGVEIKFDILEGRDHGFDIQIKEDDEPWLKEGLKWVEEKWLQ